MNSIEQDENEIESFFKFCHRKIVPWQIQDPVKYLQLSWFWLKPINYFRRKTR